MLRSVYVALEVLLQYPTASLSMPVASSAMLCTYLEAHRSKFDAARHLQEDELRAGLGRGLAHHGVGGSAHGLGPLLVVELSPLKDDAGATLVVLQNSLEGRGIRVSLGGRPFLHAAGTTADVDSAVVAIDAPVGRAVADAAFA